MLGEGEGAAWGREREMRRWRYAVEKGVQRGYLLLLKPRDQHVMHGHHHAHDQGQHGHVEAREGHGPVGDLQVAQGEEREEVEGQVPRLHVGKRGGDEAPHLPLMRCE
jgi:hypothetical protein